MIKISSIFWTKPRFTDPYLVPFGKEYGFGCSPSSGGYLDGSGTGFGYNNPTYDSGIGFGFGVRNCRGDEHGRGFGIGLLRSNILIVTILSNLMKSIQVCLIVMADQTVIATDVGIMLTMLEDMGTTTVIHLKDLNTVVVMLMIEVFLTDLHINFINKKRK